MAMKRVGPNATPMRLSFPKRERLMDLVFKSPTITHKQALRLIAEAERDACRFDFISGWRGVAL